MLKQSAAAAVLLWVVASSIAASLDTWFIAVNVGIPKLIEDVPGKPEDEFGDVSHLLGKQSFRLAKKPADDKPREGRHVQRSTQQPQTMKYVFRDLSGKEHWYELVDDAEEPAEQAACAEDTSNADKVTNL